MTQALLLWLVVYAGLVAIFGFGLSVFRSFTGRPWSVAWILRTSSLTAFLLTTVMWVLGIVID